MERHHLRHTVWFKDLGMKDVPLVGGKNASLGELYNHLAPLGVNIPNGFAVTSAAYFYFLKANELEEKIQKALAGVDTHNLSQLAKRGKRVRGLLLKARLPEDLAEEIIRSYRVLSESCGVSAVDCAVRSSATAEDLPGASFAGQQETFLNVSGEGNIVAAVKKCFASLFTDRAIAYRQQMGFSHTKVGLSAGVQKMVRSDRACSGIMFSCDTDSGFADVTLINASYGLGKNIVGGRVEPDQYYVFEPMLKQGFKPIVEKRLGSKLVKMVYEQNAKQPTRNVRTSAAERASFVLKDEEILQLARWSAAVEEHYQKPMDMEWAKDGVENKLYLVQARPETVQSKRNVSVLEEYRLQIGDKKPIVAARGMSAGSKIGAGKTRVIKNVSAISRFKKGEVLVTRMTDPDWVPAMRMASAIEVVLSFRPIVPKN